MATPVVVVVVVAVLAVVVVAVVVVVVVLIALTVIVLVVLVVVIFAFVNNKIYICGDTTDGVMPKRIGKSKTREIKNCL